MTTAEYWVRRALEDKIAVIEDANRQIRSIRKIFRGAQNDLEGKIGRILKSISGDAAEARRIISITELSGLRKQYAQLIDMLDDPKSAQLANQLMDSLYKSNRVTRFDAMLAQVGYYNAQLYRDSAKVMRDALTSSANTAYFRKAFDFEQLAGVELQWATLDARRLDVLISSKWSGKNWSDRLWGHVKNFDEKLKNVISRGMLTGEDTHAMAAELSKLTNSTRHNAERIMRTETAFISERASQMAYEEFGVEKYRFLATLDLKTSEICRLMDGKVFDRKDAKAGINYPPLHPNCRSTTIPEMEDMDLLITERAARDPITGKTVSVKDMNYQEWYKTRVVEDMQDFGRKSAARGANFSREAADELYPDLKPNAKDAMIKAHNDVLDYGLKHGREKAVAIDWKTGKRLKVNTGGERSVSLDTGKYPEGSVIVVHNHPSGNSFSVADMISLNRKKERRTMAIQGHNGVSYSLSIGNGKRLKAPKADLKASLMNQVEQLQEILYEPGMARNELSHRVVKEIAKSYGWEYTRKNP